MKTTIQLPHGYTATVCQDETPGNPFKDWDTGPPMAVYYDRRIYSPAGEGEEITLADLFDEIPEISFFAPGDRAAIMEAAGIDPENVELPEDETSAEAWRWAIREALDGTADQWGKTSDYFDAMQAVAGLAGVPCHRETSRGHSQSDWAEVFVAAMPAWREKVGVPLKSCECQCEAAFELYTDWAWGDVYGVFEILRPDGSELEDGSTWGFYGREHEESGLMEFCRDAVESDLASLAKEETEARDAACRDIAAV